MCVLIQGLPYALETLQTDALTASLRQEVRSSFCSHRGRRAAVGIEHTRCAGASVAPRVLSRGRGQRRQRVQICARFARLAFLHDLADCTWVLLWRTDHRCGQRCRHCAPFTLPASESCPCIRKLKLAAVRSVRALVGLVTAVDYGDCLYCFNFAVAPKLRGRGLGRRLQHECQRIALRRGFWRVAGTVDTSSPRLVGYYLALGGRLVPTGAPCRARSGNTLVVIGSVS